MDSRRLACPRGAITLWLVLPRTECRDPACSYLKDTLAGVEIQYPWALFRDIRIDETLFRINARGETFDRQKLQSVYQGGEALVLSETSRAAARTFVSKIWPYRNYSRPLLFVRRRAEVMGQDVIQIFGYIFSDNR